MPPRFRQMPSALVKMVTDASSMTMDGPREALEGPADAAVTATRDETWTLELWLRVIGLGVGMAFFLTFAGAFGTGDAPFVRRLIYWQLIMLCGSLLAVGVNWLIRVYVLGRAPLLVQEIVSAIATTAAITLTVWGITPAYWGHDWNSAVIPMLAPIVFLVTLVMTFLHYLIERQPRRSHAFAPAPVEVQTTEVAALSPPQIVFFERLPPKFQNAAIRALSAEDHYLRVHTDRGETLILMRLYDAIRELEGIEGSQTHRSWWVAKDAIIEVVRRDGRYQFRLEGGLNVPVSRSFQKALKDEAWI